MKLLLAITVLLALHCNLSQGSSIDSLKEMLEEVEKKEEAERELQEKKEQGSLIDSLKEMLQEVEKKEEAERELQEKKKEQDEENALLEKLVEKLSSDKDKRGLLDSIMGTAGKYFGDIKETFADTFGIDYNRGDSIKLDDLSTSNTDPCDDPILLDNGQKGDIDFPSKDHKDKYSRNKICEWVIKADSDKHIRVNFTYMDIRERGDCDDNVQIYTLKCTPTEKDGNRYRGVNLTKKICSEGGIKGAKDLGDKKIITIPSRCAYIRFRSSWGYQAYGFSLTYDFVNPA